MTVGEFLELLTWQDLLDIAIVAIVFYNLLLLIRGTRAVQILVGLAFVAATSYLARWANLVALETLIQKFLIILPFALGRALPAGDPARPRELRPRPVLRRRAAHQTDASCTTSCSRRRRSPSAAPAR